MDNSLYTYEGKMWRPVPTIPDKDSFFHAAFGKKAHESTAYVDKHAKVKRLHWAALLTYHLNEVKPPSLVEVLRKCFCANSKFKHSFVEDNAALENYVSDILRSPQDVTIEEVAMLATLENVRVVVLSKGQRDGVVIVEPCTELLGDYLNAERVKEEVVLCLEGSTFWRMQDVERDGAVAELDEKIADPTTTKDNTKFKYDKTGNSGIKGHEYQIGILVVLLLNSLQKLRRWWLSTENKAAGKFDDAVLERPDGTILIQTKHKTNRPVTLEDLLSTNAKNDFSLAKYFLSYQEIKTKFQVQNVVICTNAGFEDKVKKYLKKHSVGSENMLYYGQSNSLYYTFNEDILELLREKVSSYYKINYGKKDIDKAVITDENLKDFLLRLQLYSNYPSGNEIGKVMEKLLSIVKGYRPLFNLVSTAEIYAKVMNWFQDKNGVYLTETSSMTLFAEIWRDRRWHTLDEYNVHFQRNDSKFTDTEKLLFIKVESGYLLQELRICTLLKKKNVKMLRIASEDSFEMQIRIIEAFALPMYTHLIIIWSTVTHTYITREIGLKLRSILDKYQHKKVVVLAKENELLPYITSDSSTCCVINETLRFRDLSTETQARLLKKRNIIFQGKPVSLEELIKQGDYGKVIHQDILEPIIKDEFIRVGLPPLDLNQDISAFYIHRKFEKVVDKNELSGESKEITIIPEESIYDSNDKMILLSDQAGTGKTTVLTKLATMIKNKHPELWVIRVELNGYTKVLKEVSRSERPSINIKEFLNARRATKLTNRLEEELFSLKERVVLMLDGLDEIAPDYKDLVVKLLIRCQKHANFAKIFISTRPHMAKELRKKLKTNPIVLMPLTEQDQINFLTDYWSHNLELNQNDKEKCKEFSKILISRMCFSTRNTSSSDQHFAAIPLQMRMLAEIFQERDALGDWDGCKEYLMKDRADIKLPERLNTAKLYGIFLEKKRSIFLERENPYAKGTVKIALNLLFENCLGYHRTLALKATLEETKCTFFSQYPQSYGDLDEHVWAMGIVYKIDGEIRFIHKTFAEYFLAESILIELQQGNQSVDFQKFLIDEVLSKDQFKGVCAFLDNFLQKTIDQLPSNIFHNYQSITEEIRLDDSHKFFLLHHLANQGFPAIIQLLLKCCDCEIVRNTSIDVTSSYFSRNIQKYNPGNTLLILQDLVRQGGVNIRTERRMTPLHLAAQNGHIETVRYLVWQGADINRSIFNCTPLWLAVLNGNIEVVKFLVQQGVEIRRKGEYTILWDAVKRSRSSIAAYLLETVLEKYGLETSDPLVAYTAAYLGRLGVIEKLVERGLDLKCRLKNGETLIFGAARGEQQDVIRYLMKNKVEIDATDIKGNTALHTVVENCGVTLVEFLFKNGADVSIRNKSGLTPLHVACRRDRIQAVNFLLHIIPNVDVQGHNGWTVLHYAAQSGWLSIVQTLIDVYKARTDIKDESGRTPLHLASATDELDIVGLLAGPGASLTVPDLKGQVPFHLAAISGALRTVTFFIERGIDTSIADNYGRTALHLSVEKGHGKVVEYMLQRVVNVDSIDKNGSTPLHLAVARGDLKMAQLLLNYGASVDIKDKDGRLVRDMVQKERYSRMAKFRKSFNLFLDAQNQHS